MSITNELREWASVEVPYKYGHELLDIADRIDAEHERVCKEQYACGAEHGIGASIEASMIQEHGFIELPKDADGVPICIGDVMSYMDGTWPMEVVALVPPAVFLTEDGPRYADMCRHHHEPTVEDVLRDFSCVLMGKQEFDGDVAEAISEYAAKLRLVGDGE